TIVRFAYRLGLDGYPELQERVRELVRSRFRGADEGAGDENAVAHLGQGTAAASLRHDLDNLRHTIADLDGATIEKAIGLLTAAPRVFFTGGLASKALADYAAHTLNRLRGNVRMLSTDDASADILEMTADDVLVVISFPPYASQTLQVLKAARSRDVTIVGITDSPISPLGEVDVTLSARVSGIGPQNSLVAPVAVVNVLLNGVAEKSPGSADRYRQIFGLFDEWNSFVLKGNAGG
ncbi:MAG TPA: MurR/RpiR family transcriptional regulator, partial [Trebonia sp.]|nr:MurR/RpiR family transcriptional regulator [Trebonia sp.]